MFESVEAQKELFKEPNFEFERREFERVAKTFDVDTETLMFLAREEGKLQKLNEETWKVLENTDSYDIQRDGWRSVQAHSESQEPPRDWKKTRHDLENEVSVYAPIIMKQGTIYHLVSGNTRLMVARAMGIDPRVLIFEYKHDRTNEESH